jgi:hypothetical protein
MLRVAAFLCLFLTAVSIKAQFPVRPHQVSELEQKFAIGFRGDPLECSIDVRKPFLDFAFRFEAGFIVTCPINQFGGEESKITSLIRIRPEAGTPVYLVDVFQIPAVPERLRAQIKLDQLHSDIEFSQVFAAGEGTYRVDLAVIDNQRRVFQKSWTTRAEPHGHEKKANILLAPSTAMAAVIPPWHWHPNQGPNALRLTVLLDGAPASAFSQKLRAWDRAFLLDSLSTLLREIPSASLRVVVFNVEQQQVFFEDDDFDGGGFRRLSSALEAMELATISFRHLQSQKGWAYLLAKLVNEEAANVRRPDAIIFLGPRIRVLQKTPREMLNLPNGHPPFFYFEYLPAWGDGYPDAIHTLVNECNGTVLKSHSPGDFAEAIKKLQNKLGQKAVAVHDVADEQ